MPRRRSGKKIDFTHWQGGVSVFTALAASTVALTVAAAQHLPETILRTRGSLLAFLDGSLAPGRHIGVAVGLILVPEGTGSTVLWSPLTDTDAPWFYWTGFGLGYNEAVTDAIGAPGADVYREVVDSKAMRIVKNMEVQMVAENVTLETAAACNISMACRILSGT